MKKIYILEPKSELSHKSYLNFGIHVESSSHLNPSFILVLSVNNNGMWRWYETSIFKSCQQIVGRDYNKLGLIWMGYTFLD